MSHSEAGRAFPVDLDAPILVVDVETGGFDPNNESILSIGAVEWTRDGLGKSLELYVTEQEIVMSMDSAKFNAALLETVLTNGVAPSQAAQRH
jgi:DNA polymerase III epsilon subunit-like protein